MHPPSLDLHLDSLNFGLLRKQVCQNARLSMAMSCHPRIESKTKSSFLTSRCKNSELWFANNLPVERAILGYLAKYAERYQVKLYAFALEGSHLQSPAQFPLGNRADFMRVFNSQTARCVDRLTPNFPGGGLFGRRYSSEFVDGDADMEHYFFYTVLQPVQDCLVERISDYPFYNCFSDAVNGLERKVEVVRWGDYYLKSRYNSKLSVKDFTDTYTLKYERLPGYQHLTQKEYSKLMHQKLEERRAAIVNQLKAEGRTFMGKEALLKVIPGTPAKNPKTSNSKSHRPRVLSLCPNKRAILKAWYFDLYFKYKAISKLYRAGDRTVQFPPGMYPPSLPCNFSP